MGSYLLQSSTGTMPISHSSILANFWMVMNSIPSNQVMRVALLPSQQLRGSSSSGGGNNGLGEGQLGMFAGLNQYRGGGGVSESQTSGSHSHHGGGTDDRHNTISHHS
ncbi:hypothetical protein RDI58_005107 [Solanum bulbocastanum]|uniref:Uncharacterized protein n=1 Tax=Solanum bulbocastanum TaxID=147425 RepID=A0AAN8U097_SOLBU